MTYTATTDPALRSFVDAAPDSDFPIQNLPLGVFRRAPTDPPHIGVAIGDHVLDLTLLEVRDFFTDPPLRDARPFARATLNAFLSLGTEAWSAVRTTVSRLLTGENPTLRDDAS
ncbi:MAG TPA: fumarylacetoacetase, partial [Rhodothermales bacterium]